MLKKSKKIFRDFFRHFAVRRKTLNEKKQNSDPEISKYVRDGRKPKNIPDSYTDTKWIKRIEDKSWKSHCKKRKQYIRHDKSFKEEEQLNETNKILQALKYKYRDKEWHEIPLDSRGFPTTHEMSEELIWLKKFIKMKIFEAQYKTVSRSFFDFGNRIVKTEKVIEKVRLK